MFNTAPAKAKALSKAGKPIGKTVGEQNVRTDKLFTKKSDSDGKVTRPANGSKLKIKQTEY